MRIVQCILSKNGVYGGGENIVRHFCLNREINNNIFVISNSLELINKLNSSSSLKLKYVNIYKLNLMGLLLFSYQLLLIVIKFKPNIIISHHRFSTIASGIINLLFPFKLVHYIHYFSTNAKFITLLCSNYISVSSALKEFWVNHYNVKSEKIKVIYNGVDSCIKNIQRINDFIEKYNVNEKDINICILGRLTHLKGHIYLIKAIHDIYQSDNSFPLKLFIIGDGELKNSLIDLVEKLNLNNNVVFTDFVQTPQEVLPVFDIFVQPSISEGLPFTLIEAMSAELLIIASNIKPNIEVLGNDYDFLFKSEDYIDLKNKLLLSFEKFNDRIYLDNYYSSIVEKYQRRFTKDKMIENYNRYVEEI